jgi:hypothetical protein
LSSKNDKKETILDKFVSLAQRNEQVVYRIVENTPYEIKETEPEIDAESFIQSLRKWLSGE